jgi:hypothetical protein
MEYFRALQITIDDLDTLRGTILFGGRDGDQETFFSAQELARRCKGHCSNLVHDKPHRGAKQKAISSAALEITGRKGGKRGAVIDIFFIVKEVEGPAKRTPPLLAPWSFDEHGARE